MNQSTHPFGEKYSRYYDLIYSDKNYEKECDYLEEIFRRNSERKVHRVLDVACGTGGHAIILAKRGYQVCASDLSSSMLAIVGRKASEWGLSEQLRFQQSDMRSIQGEGGFDACICMFAAIDYLIDYSDVLSAFSSVHKQLAERALFVFDFWNGLAVLTVGPTERVKRIKSDNLLLIRWAKPTLKPLVNTNSTEYTTMVLEGGMLKEEFRETHTVRYFFPEEIRFLLRMTGFELLTLHPFLQPEREITPEDWNITAVARRGKPA